jgi:hypothetical protein
MNDVHPEDHPTLFPDSATRRASERFAQTHNSPIANLAALEASLRRAQPGEALEVEPQLMDEIIKNRHPLLAERETTHGNYQATALIAQRFKDISKSTPNWSGNLTDVQRESLEAIFTKIARILSGDPNHPDHWRDVEGQAHLVTETLV